MYCTTAPAALTAADEAELEAVSKKINKTIAAASTKKAAAAAAAPAAAAKAAAGKEKKPSTAAIMAEAEAEVRAAAKAKAEAASADITEVRSSHISTQNYNLHLKYQSKSTAFLGFHSLLLSIDLFNNFSILHTSPQLTFLNPLIYIIAFTFMFV